MKNIKMLSSMILLLLFSDLSSGAEMDDSKNIGVHHYIMSEKVKINPDLRLRDKFDYSSYFGIIHSQRELNTLWSQLINIQKEYYHNYFARIPNPPQIDFDNYIVLWFANQGVGASFVESLEITENEDNNSLSAIIHVFHSDFLSRDLNLWKTSKTNKIFIFKVEHRYENPRGP